MTVTLTLGDVTFAGFEIPESMPWGGEQALIVHKLPGGNRIVDAMGRDQSDIEWSGRFRGLRAEARAKRLDFLCAQGNPLLLSWSTFRYTVLIASFRPDFRQSYEIPYKIACRIVNDDFDATNSNDPGIDELFNADLAELIQASVDIGSEVVLAVASVQDASAAVQSLKSADKATLSSIQSAINAAQSVTQAAIGTGNTVVAANGSVAGLDPLQTALVNANALTGQAGAFVQLGQLYQVSSLLGRMNVNLSNVGS